MSIETQVLAACLIDRQAYETLQLHAGVQEFSPLGQHWYNVISGYYERDKDAKKADYRLVKELGMQAADMRHHDTLAGYYDNIPVVGASAANITQYVLELRRQNVGMQLAAMLTNPDSDKGRLKEIVESYQGLLAATELGLTKLRVLDFDDLDNVYDEDKIVKLYPNALMRQCLGGGAMPGHHLLIYGRPEAGKSLFAINTAAGIANSGKKVIYFGNEENIQTVGIRIACNLAKRNISEYQEHSAEIRRTARSRGLDNITVVELVPGTFAEIETAVAEYQPDAIVVDQLPGIDVGESNPVRSMDKAARAMRTVLLRNGLVGISVSQAGDRTERHGQMPPAWLTMSDVYGSRTGLPAQCDLMLGIGFDQEMYDRNIRACSLPKNKIGGMHEGFKVRIDIQQSKVWSLAA